MNLRLELRVRIAGAGLDRTRIDLQPLSQHRHVLPVGESVTARPGHRRPLRSERRCECRLHGNRSRRLSEEGLRQRRDGTGESTGGISEHDRRRPIDRRRYCRVVGKLEGDLGLESFLDLAARYAAGCADPVRHDGDTLSRESEPVDRLQADANVLERRHLWIADQHEAIGVVERGQHRTVEKRPGVDDDGAVGLASRGEDARELRLADDLRFLRALRRRQQVEHRARVGADERFELLDVRLAARGGEVGNRRSRSDRKRERRVAELEVEIDEQRRDPGATRGHGDVRCQNRLAAAALGREHRHDRAGIWRVAVCPCRFLQGEEQRLHRLGQHDHVGCADLEPGIDNAVRFAVGSEDQRRLGERANGADVFPELRRRRRDNVQRHVHGRVETGARRVACQHHRQGLLAFERRRELVCGRAAEQDTERLAVTVHRRSPGTARRSAPADWEARGRGS